ncbi:MAG: LysM peptidoglycan-binding domain-containing M23 family metallopeptidase [Pseudomonadota bacterium]
MKKIFLLSSCLIAAACSQEPVGFYDFGPNNMAGSVGVHTVLPGETVYEISQNYRLPMREIITVNNIQAPYVLKAGYRLQLPPPNEHRVRFDDTVFSIAKLYEVNVNRLVSLNDLTPPYKLQAGQVLRLPTPTRVQEAVAKENIQKVERNNPTQSTARIASVRGEALDAPVTSTSTPQPIESAVQTRVTPQAKPQQASVASRPVVPKETPQLSGNGQFMRPVSGRVISSFGPKDGGLHNDGINIKAPRGTPVRAAQNGVVVYAGDDLEGYGNLILVRHQGKMMTAYAHLDKMLVQKGVSVQRGESIGTVGSTGAVDTPQLHFEIREGSTPLNPDRYL